jgi:hypothetical protein
MIMSAVAIRVVDGSSDIVLVDWVLFLLNPSGVYIPVFRPVDEVINT